jgi:hypothetical protein
MNTPTLAELNRIVESNAMTRDFVKGCAATALGRGRKSDALMIAQQQKGIPPRVLQMLQRAGAGVSDPTASGEWGLASIDLAQAFIQSLAHNGVFDAALPSMKRLPMQTRLAITTARAIGDAAVSQGQLKLVSELSFDAAKNSLRKIAIAVATTQELWRLALEGGRTHIEAELRSALASASDALFISTLSAALSPFSSVGDLRGDLMRGAESIRTGDDSVLHAVLSPTNLKRAALSEGTDLTPRYPTLHATKGGTVSGIVVQASDEITDDELLMFDAQQVAADGGAVDVNGSGEGVLDMGTGTPRSLWQRNEFGNRVERRFAFELLRADGAALINSVNYSASS